MSKTQPKELFCQTYWKKKLAKSGKSHAFDVITHYTALNKKLVCKDGITPIAIKEIANTDLQLKKVQPLKEDMTLWRGIQHYASNFYLSNVGKKVGQQFFEHCANVKKGEVISMPTYVYTSANRKFAYFHILGADDSLLLEINAPKGSQVLHDTHFILPRHSKFLCEENVELENLSQKYRHIKLTLLPRDIEIKKATFAERFKNFFGMFTKK